MAQRPRDVKRAPRSGDLKRLFTTACARCAAGGARGRGMQHMSETIDPGQSALARRVVRMGAGAADVPIEVLAAEVDAIRAAALVHGLFPAVAVTHAIAAALARGERGALVTGWIAILRDAVACDRQDARACETYAAACSIRLTG